MIPSADTTAASKRANDPRWLIASAGLALYWVIFLWNFWQKGVYALGINATVFLLIALVLFIQLLRANRKMTKRDLVWIMPFILMIISYAIYDNPFWQITSILVMPVAFVVAYLQAFNSAAVRWTPAFFGRIALRCLSLITYFSAVAQGYMSLMAPNNTSRRRLIARILTGIVIFVIIAVVIVIPLLATSDSAFKAAVDSVYAWLQTFIVLSFWYRAAAFIALALLFAAAVFAWGRPFKVIERADTVKRIDAIIVSIVLGGILVLYLLFLAIQINRLWVGALPFDFRETEQLVKSGFWQLFFLSLLNIGVYFFVYKRTARVAQYILVAFTGTSLLLLISAGYRMGLYVMYYGFSYEKFFASYAVLYCAILFAWLILQLFAQRPADILKFIAVLFLWMYAVVAVLPVEQFILRTNVALAQRQDSRIRLFELTMLSPDVLSTVKELNRTGRLQENGGYISRENEQMTETKIFDWLPWIERQEQLIADKQWYEYNLMNLLQ